MKECTRTSVKFIRNSYAQLLLYYYKMGVGSVSEITDTTITSVLIDTIEKRFKQLGGNTALLYLRASMPTPNGQLKKKKEPMR